LFAVNSVTVTYNAALKRPSYQSSVYTDSHGTSYPASLANDGHHSHCSMSRRETTPWWAVDLGGPTTVARVDLVNTPEHGTYWYCRLLNDINSLICCESVLFPLFNSFCQY